MLASIVLSFGCDDDRSVRTYQTAKETPPPASPFGSAQASSTDLPTPGPAASAPTWTLPTGWKVLPPPPEGQARQMEVARIGVSADSPTAILTIVPLGGEGGGIMSNVARWERQLNLPVSTTPEQVEKLLIQLDTSSGPALVADLTSPPGSTKPQRIVAAIMPRTDMAWFITLKGPAEAIAKQRSSFDQFVRSLHFADGDASADAAPSAPPTTSPTPPGAPDTIAYKSPADWKPAPANNDMRVLGFSAGPAMITVDRLSAAGMGSLLANVNMWRGQVGLSPLADDQSIKPDGAVTLDGHVGVLFDFTGAAGAGSKRLIISMTTVGDSDWFIKLTGPAEAVASQRSAFLSFMQSIHFAAGAGSNGGG
jgi:hypothetical protein